jgi:two-component system, cell cycle response regulator
MNLKDTGETYLLDRTGRYITAPRHSTVEPLAAQNRSAIYERAVEREISDEAYTSHSGEKVIGQYGWTKDDQWLIIGEKSYRSVFHSMIVNLLLVTCIVLAVLLTSLLLTFKLTKSVERPIQHLLVGTKIIRDGKYDYQIPKEEIMSAPVELQQLCDTFNTTTRKLKSTIQMLEQTAVVDQLTEVYNRRFILNEGLKLLETCIRANQPCTVLMIDIDFFKRVNDTYGHLVGDRVIIFAASLLLTCIRSCDMVSRYGGEEFLILAPNTGAGTGGKQLGERIRASFLDNPYREEGIEINLTVSIGSADYRKRSSYGKTALEDMISRADQALYKAKNNGRNRVEIMDGAEPEAKSGELEL